MTKENSPEFTSHRACQTLMGLTLDRLPQAGALGHVRTYRKGAAIWGPNDSADRIYFLKGGQVAVKTTDTEGHEVIINVIKVGEIFGELCFCAEEKGLRRTNACAVAASEAVEISHSDFMKYLRSNAQALHAFVVTFCVRLSDAERRTEVLAYRGAEDRLGRLLLYLVTTRGQPDTPESNKVILPISHDELAQMAAMSRSHVTVTMGKFRRRGLVHYERNRSLEVAVTLLMAYLNDDHSSRIP